MKERRYLGDGVYAYYDGYHIVLIVNDGYTTTDEIALEDSVFYALLDFAKSIYWLDDPKEENN